VLHGDIEPPELSHEDRLVARDAAAVGERIDWGGEPWKALTNELKQATGKKGRELFHPLRLALTGRESGPEMAGLVSHMGKDRAVRRLEAAAKR
jgi:glutamyl-tRNA synthetase